MNKLGRRIDEILADLGRQLRALERVLAEYNVDQFMTLYVSSDPEELRHAWELERGFEVVQNYIAELTSLSVELLRLRAKRARRGIELDLVQLNERGYLKQVTAKRLTECQAVRNTLAHEYEKTDSADLYRAAQTLLGEIPHFLAALKRIQAEAGP